MLRLTHSIAAFTAMVLLAGCATNQSKYSWGHYDQSLYDYYKHPDNAADYMAALRAAIDSAGAQQPVAPGIYAEYGYMLMQQQQYDDAVQYFEREKRAWPEASQFMEAMIRTARLGGRPPVKGDGA